MGARCPQKTKGSITILVTIIVGAPSDVKSQFLLKNQEINANIKVPHHFILPHVAKKSVLVATIGFDSIAQTQGVSESCV